VQRYPKIYVYHVLVVKRC